MNSTLRIVLPILILVAGFGIKTILLATGPQTKSQEAVSYLPLVEVMVMQAETTRVELPAFGEVRPRATTMLVAEVAARVTEVSPNLYRGAFFNAGEVMVKLNDTDYQNAVAMAAAEVQKADAALLLEEAEARVASADWNQLGEGPIPSLVAREPQLAAAHAARAAALANLAMANSNLARTVIRAPFDGRCLQRNLEVGVWVAPGVGLASIYAIDAAEVTLPIAANQLDHLGLKVDGSSPPLAVRLEAQVGDQMATWQGYIVRTEASVDPGTRMVTAIAQIDAPFRPNADGTPALAPGMFLRATIIGRELHNVFRVPRSAVLDGDRVRVVDEANQAHEIPVEVIYRTTNECLISHGLEPGTQLIISALPLFLENMDVMVFGAENGAPR
jgi:RND family efflux transporter MFP subunit